MGIFVLICTGMVLEHFLQIAGKAIAWVTKKLS